MEKRAFSGAQMLFRKPVADVFNAFIDPEVTTNFWFTRSSGKLEKGKKVDWFWDMYGASAEVEVLEIETDSLISIVWGTEKHRVDFRFTEMENGTYLEIEESGYQISAEAIPDKIRDSTGGFTTVVDGLKCWLEHGIKLNLIADKFPNK